MAMRYGLVITLLLVSVSYPEIPYTPRKSIELGGDLSFTVYDVNVTDHPSTSLYFHPVMNYYFLDWLYSGLMFYFDREVDYQGVNARWEYIAFNEYGIGTNVGFLLDLHIFVLLGAELGATFEFDRFSILDEHKTVIDTEGEFDGIGFPLTALLKIPVARNFQVNLRTTLFVGALTNDNNEFTFSIGFTGNILSDRK
ncbi:MAG: hypothetical protein JXB48_05995 [Candidatus Latescibacteria bacterium]|nr:hypothetical protein [Candidatus Latescibacterota bacterium]